MVCEFCEIIQGKGHGKIVYQDDTVLAFVAASSLVAGQVTVIPRDHIPIIELLPAPLLQHISTITKRLSVAIFEALECHGTNVLIRNGISAGQEHAHCSVDLIPRFEGDLVELDWKAQKVSPQELEEVFIQLQANAKDLDPLGKKTVSQTPKNKPEEAIDASSFPKSKDSEQENYLLKSLNRIP